MFKQKGATLALVLGLGVVVGGYNYVKQTTRGGNPPPTKGNVVFTTQSEKSGEGNGIQTREDLKIQRQNQIKESQEQEAQWLSTRDKGGEQDSLGTQQKSFSSCADQTYIPEIECEALVALYNATNGTNRKNTLNNDHPWLVDENPCFRFGVDCDMGHVEILYPQDNNLQGTIPAELVNLTQLQRLRLDNNQLYGTIPAELGSLAELGILSLDNNQLSGPIPVQLSYLSKLEGLFLANNQLTGPIPPEFGTLSQLQVLGLQDNQLQGPVPAELGNLYKLRYLWLSDNQLCGTIPESFLQLTTLQTLIVENNYLTSEGYSPQMETRLNTHLYGGGVYGGRGQQHPELCADNPPETTIVVSPNLLSFSCGGADPVGMIEITNGESESISTVKLNFQKLGLPNFLGQIKRGKSNGEHGTCQTNQRNATCSNLQVAQGEKITLTNVKFNAGACSCNNPIINTLNVKLLFPTQPTITESFPLKACPASCSASTVCGGN